MTPARQSLERLVERRLRDFADSRVIQRIWDGDPTVWGQKPETPELGNRLGWLSVGEQMRGHVEDLQRFAEEVRRAFDRVVLLGMGGSSLAPEVLWRTFGRRDGYPVFQMLDSTDPRAVRAVEDGGDLERTVFIVSSKSGTTVETMSFFRHFWDRAHADGSRFVAITDPGTSLERLGVESQFRRVFLNPPNIGGRYSALSLFGLVPAALMGLDVAILLDRAEGMADRCRPTSAEAANPGATLGALMGEAAHVGRDKLTIVLSPRVASFGLWVEQLVAESTGKAGKGILPVACEPSEARPQHCDDRLFVAVSLTGDGSGAFADRVDAVEAEGYPLVRLDLTDPYDLGAEFFRWEFATAVAATVLRVNPFDQPNVAESKRNTDKALAQRDARGESLDPRRSAVTAFLGKVRAGDYVCVQAFIAPSERNDERLGDLCNALRDRLDAVVTIGYGPRYLHSTGQLHKGGPPNGHFIQVVENAVPDVTIPETDFTFGELLAAQALGDYEALTARGRPVLRVSDPAVLMELM